MSKNKSKQAQKTQTIQPTVNKTMTALDQIKDLDAQIDSLNSEAKSVQDKFSAYAKNVGEEIVKILNQAGVFDKINKLELARQEVSGHAQQRIAEIRRDTERLLSIKTYLMESSGMSQDEASEPVAQKRDDTVPPFPKF